MIIKIYADILHINAFKQYASLSNWVIPVG